MDKITALEIKRNNRNNIYTTIYRMHHVSKQQLAEKLQLSLPTITHNLKELEELNLIQKDGFFESTASGGRKAQIISCNRQARIAIGVEVLKHTVHIVASDLYGTLLAQNTLQIDFECSTLYYCAIGNWINNFISEHSFPKESILGVNIAMQGLVSADRQKIIYGEILNCTDLTVSEFSSYIQYPCTFMHDTEAAAFTEIWRRHHLSDSIYLLINMTMGGAIIIDGKVHGGKKRASGTIEHMCLYPGGKPCYCGRHGCVEPYCNLHALLEDSHAESLQEFFDQIENGSETHLQVWHQYLHNLALAINNALRVIDCDIILSGTISLFLTDDDLELLQQYLDEVCSFPYFSPRIRLGFTAPNVAALGAAYHLVADFLENDSIFQ